MRAKNSFNRLKMFAFAFLLGVPTGAWGAGPADEPVTYTDCARQIQEQARRLWTPDAVSARTLDGKYELTLRLAYRLRSYFEVSNGLATKLALSAPGLRFVVALFEGAQEKFRAELEATLSEEEKRELALVLPLLRTDSGFLTLINQLYTAGNQVFGFESPWREQLTGDPLFIPLLATFCGAVGESATRCILQDFESRYGTADQIEIAKQMALALSTDAGLRVYVAGLFSQQPFSMDGVVGPRNRIAMDGVQYLQTLAKAAGYENLSGLNKILVDAWKDRTGHLTLTFDGTVLPFWRYATSVPGQHFTRALIHIVKGQDEQAREALDYALAQLRQLIEISPVMETRIRAAVFSAAMDRRFRLTALGEFMAAGMGSPELLLASIAIRNLQFAETRGGTPFRSMAVRPQQVPLINAALLYASLVPGSKILEVGYEKPVLMVTLRYYLPHISLAVGVDPAPPPQAEVTDALKPKIELLQGRLLTEPETTRKVESKGPYHLIYGVDVFRKTYGGWGADFDPSTDMQAYLRWVNDNLSEGGTFLVLNDNEELPNFTRQQAEQAGLTVVRWGEDWSLNPELRELLAGQAANLGGMRLFVFRKGAPLSLGPAIGVTLK